MAAKQNSKDSVSIDLYLADLAGMSRTSAEEAIRRRVQTVYLGKERVLARVLGRQKLYLSTRDVGFAGNVMMDGYWEIWLTLFASRFVKPGMVVVDVGANFGYYTLLFGEAVGETGRVIAIEPVPETVELLKMSVDLNGFGSKTEIMATALGRTVNSKAFVHVPATEPKNATVVYAENDYTIEVPSSTIDQLLRHHERIDLIKIDAEGSEEEIFHGMKETIRLCKPDIIMEFNPLRYTNPEGFFNELVEASASVSWIDFEGDLHPVTYHEMIERLPKQDWLLFLTARKSSIKAV